MVKSLEGVLACSDIKVCVSAELKMHAWFSQIIATSQKKWNDVVIVRIVLVVLVIFDELD